MFRLYGCAQLPIVLPDLLLLDILLLSKTELLIMLGVFHSFSEKRFDVFTEQSAREVLAYGLCRPLLWNISIGRDTCFSEENKAIQLTKFLILVRKTWMPKSSNWRMHISFFAGNENKVVWICPSNSEYHKGSLFAPYRQLVQIQSAWTVHSYHFALSERKLSWVTGHCRWAADLRLACCYLPCSWCPRQISTIFLNANSRWMRNQVATDMVFVDAETSQWPVLCPRRLSRVIHLWALQKSSRSLFTQEIKVHHINKC